MLSSQPFLTNPPGAPLRQVVRVLLVALLGLAAAGCSPGGAALRYTYPPGRVTTYRWTVDATTTPAAVGAGTLHLEAVIRERVSAPVAGGGGRLEVVLQAGRVLQDGRDVNPGPPLGLDLDVGPDGQVTRVGETPSLPAGTLRSLDLGHLLAESRPPLPARRVRLRDQWPADLATSGTAATPATPSGTGTIDLSGTGRLDRFALRDGRRIAGITIERRGRVAIRPDTPGNPGTVTGTAADTTVAEVDLDRGLILDATSRELTEVTLASGPVRVAFTTRVVLGG